MQIDVLIKWIMAVSLAVGAVDLILGGRFGLGKEFENGIMTAGRLILFMAGFMALAPVLAGILTPVFGPLFQRIGVDPSMLAGILLANDAGAAPLAMEMALDPTAGRFSGWIVGSMMGTTVMFVFPMAVGVAKEGQKPAVLYGLLVGIATAPIGCLCGGLAAGFPVRLVLRNLIPVLFVSGSLLAGLLCLGQKLIPAFIWFGRAVTALSCAGLVIGAVGLLTGFRPIPGMGSMEEAFVVIGNIAVFLAGAFPLIALLRRVLGRFFAALGDACGVNEAAVSGLFMTLANGIPTFGLLDEMNDRGIIMNLAFMVCASCAIGDHLAYTAGTAPELTMPVLAGKLAGGAAALLAAMALEPKLMGRTPHFSGKDRKPPVMQQ